MRAQGCSKKPSNTEGTWPVRGSKAPRSQARARGRFRESCPWRAVEGGWHPSPVSSAASPAQAGTLPTPHRCSWRLVEKHLVLKMRWRQCLVAHEGKSLIHPQICLDSQTGPALPPPPKSALTMTSAWNCPLTSTRLRSQSIGQPLQSWESGHGLAAGARLCVQSLCNATGAHAFCGRVLSLQLGSLEFCLSSIFKECHSLLEPQFIQQAAVKWSTINSVTTCVCAQLL